MGRKAFDKIAEGLKEALAVATGEARPAKLYVPPEIDVKHIRQKLGLSQDDFAAHFGFSINQIRDWENSLHKCPYCSGVADRWPCMSKRDATNCPERRRLKLTPEEEARLVALRKALGR